jgi:hypothetical protein
MGKWEQALAEQTRIEGAHERFQREQPQALSPAEIAAFRLLATDLRFGRAPLKRNVSPLSASCSHAVRRSLRRD